MRNNFNPPTKKMFIDWFTKTFPNAKMPAYSGKSKTFYVENEIHKIITRKGTLILDDILPGARYNIQGTLI